MPAFSFLWENGDRMNLELLAEAFPAGLDGALIDSAVNRRYFTGFSSSAGLLVATKKGSVFLTDSRYIEAARDRVDCCEVTELKNLEEQLPEIARRFGCRRLALESERLSCAQARRFAKYLGGVEIVDDGSLDKSIDGLRAVKSEEEIALVKAAQRIAEKAFDHILGFIKEGVTERETALELDFFMLKNGADAVSFQTIVAGGPNSSVPHWVASDRAFERGDFITMDFGAETGGCRSDMTRTVALGCADGRQAKVYQTVLEAQTACLNALAPGLACKDADKAARDVIAAAGYGAFFGHGTGHGVGLEIHEEPTLSPRGEGALAQGSVVTVEPGIYIPGVFGVRIEDMALITAGGCENLTRSAKDFLVI